MGIEIDNEGNTNFETKLLELVEKKSLLELLNLKDEVKIEERSRFLWAWPNIEILELIKSVLEKYNTRKILSVGCGSGLLEWIIQEYTGIQVNGLELDQSWWSSPYAPNKFIKLHYTPKCLTSKFLCSLIEDIPNELDHGEIYDINNNFALLFCYFNNGNAFCDYIKHFCGNLVIIIGPGPGRGTYTDPQPLNPDFGEGNGSWKMINVKEIGKSKDFISIWKR